MGWKETVRMNPLEDIIVAMRPTAPTLPFTVPDSMRPLDVTMPVSAMNPMTNFGREYVWHCHILGHEEFDLMRPLVLKAHHIGVFRGNGQWYLDVNGNSAWDAGIDKSLVLGTAGNTSIIGDWDGSGIMSIGTFNAGSWTLLYANGTTSTTVFGGAGDVPVVGDWNGDGRTKIGVFRGNGTWYFDMNGNGIWDAGDEPSFSADPVIRLLSVIGTETARQRSVFPWKRRMVSLYERQRILECWRCHLPVRRCWRRSGCR